MTSPSSPDREGGMKMAAKESVVECNDNPKGNESPTPQPTLKAHHETPVNPAAAAEEILAADQDPSETSNATKGQPVTKKKKKSRLTQREIPNLGDPPEGPKQRKYLNRKETDALLIESAEAISKAVSDLGKARALANRAGLSVDSCIIVRERSSVNDDEDLNPSTFTTLNPLSTAPRLRLSNLTTGGHCNTDHFVLRTGNDRVDRIAELKRNLLKRARAMQPESRSDSRWDKPRKVGERRRRIIREKDLPNAPPEPPASGYVLFVSQMTTKIRHDRPNVPHDQTKVVQEISKIWKYGMRDEDQKYYTDFAVEARKEYEKQQIEFRATGSFTPSSNFHKLDGVNVWVRSKWDEKNGLEQELAQYDSFQFPRRPPELDQRYNDQLEVSKIRRKLKLKGLLNEDASVKDSIGESDMKLVREYENALARLERHAQWKGPNSDTTDEQIDTKLAGLLCDGIPVRYSFLRSQFSKSVTDETILKALDKCALMIRGNFILKSSLLSFSPEIAQARTFILFILQTDGFLSRGRIERAFKEEESANSISEDAINMILEQVGLQSQEGWKLKLEDDKSVMESHPGVACNFLRFWGDQVDRFGSLLNHYRSQDKSVTNTPAQVVATSPMIEFMELGDESDILVV